MSRKIFITKKNESPYDICGETEKVHKLGLADKVVFRESISEEEKIEVSKTCKLRARIFRQ